MVVDAGSVGYGRSPQESVVFEIDERIVAEEPVEAVRSFVMDAATELLWEKTLVQVRRLTDAPRATGSRALEVCLFVGRRSETVWEMVEFEAAASLPAG